jgi:hypothetical protein
LISPTISENGGITKTSDRYGNANAAYLFDGSNDFLSLTPDTTLNDFSIAFDFYVDPNADRWERLFDFGRGSFGDLFLTVNGGRTAGNFELTIHDSLNVTYTVNPGVTPTLNAWQHMAVTYDKGGDGMKFYLNGVLVGSNAYNAESFSDCGSTQNWYLGEANWNDLMFKGMIGGVTLADSALSNEAVAALSRGQSIAQVSAPTTMTMLALGIAGLLMRRKKA